VGQITLTNQSQQLPALILVQFVYYYTYNMNKSMIRTSDCIDSLPVDWFITNLRSKDEDAGVLFIQDPFLQDINLGRFVTNLSLQKIRSCMHTAYTVLASAKSDVNLIDQILKS